MIRIRQIKVEVTKDNEITLKKLIAQKLKINVSEIIDYKIIKQSIDARKEDIFYVYEVEVNTKNEDKILKNNQNKDIFKSNQEIYDFKINHNLKVRPIIVGSGPSGLFAALIFLENGIKPLIIERGENLEERIKTIEDFFQNNNLKENSNIQFGLGGAGTFSDGKLNTLIKDKENYMSKVFETFVKFGAPKEILYTYKPHIGTDMLRIVIKNMRDEIVRLGGTFLFNTSLTDLIIENNTLKGIIVNDKEKLDCDMLLLAIGNSARDTFRKLNEKKVLISSKPFAVGLRVIHNQELIDKSLLGKYEKILSPSTYKLTYQTKNNRGVYSFCMCPGGFVVNASSELNRLVVNGMSYYKRDSGFANSAIVVTVNELDYGNNVLDGLKFQEDLESKAYKLGNGLIPIQTLKDFKSNQISDNIICKGIKGKYILANLNEILPEFISDSIKETFIYFGEKIKDFDNDNTILAGVEARTSSPIRINRNEFYESNIKGIFPIGEGSGYAGGITSSAIDGIKVVKSILENNR